MTKDLAILIAPDQPHLTTDAFLEAIDAELKARMGVAAGATA
jgi:isocitrate dehydrogenase